MTLGLAALVAGWLNTLRGNSVGTTYTAPTHIYMKLHTGDPSAAGTANASAVTTRVEVQFAAESGGQIALSNAPSWSMTATETISDISLWDALTAGNCLLTGAATAAKSVTSGDTLTLTTFTVALGPVAV